MNQIVLATRAKTHYSEQEAAEELGVSVQDFRTLIRSHIVDNEEDLNKVGMASFQASDLLVLKLLAGSRSASASP
jgi:hypothetical protein